MNEHLGNVIKTKNETILTQENSPNMAYQVSHCCFDLPKIPSQ